MVIRIGWKRRLAPLAGFLLLAGASCWAYDQQKGPSAAFEVVNIKLIKNASPYWQRPVCRGNTFMSPNMPVRYLAEWAYSAKRYQLTGKWPPWAESLPFFIEAKAAGEINLEACKGMVRVLLADEFQLSLRRGRRMMDVYALVVGSRKPELHRVDIEGKKNSAAANLDFHGTTLT